jgi:hypothetical protein
MWQGDRQWLNVLKYKAYKKNCHVKKTQVKQQQPILTSLYSLIIGKSHAPNIKPALPRHQIAGPTTACLRLVAKQ